jgi:putative ABC transport system ATP-binding protein
LWDEQLQQGSISYQSPEAEKAVDYSTLAFDAKARLRLYEFGFIFQAAYMISHLTCAENMAMPLALQGMPHQQRKQRVEHFLHQADPTGKLSLLAGNLAGHVSGGEAQRMGLLRALIHNPRVLFADEPLSSLDPKNADHILSIVRRWKSGELHEEPRTNRTLVLVTHHIELALTLAEEVAVIHEGSLVGGKPLPAHELTAPQVKCMMICGAQCCQQCTTLAIQSQPEPIRSTAES